MNDLFDCVLGNVARPRHEADLIFDTVVLRLEHVLGKIDQTVSGCFCSDEASAPSDAFSCEYARKLILDFLVGTEEESYLTFTNSLVQVVSPAGSTCTPATTLTPDPVSFDTVLLNNVCNGPGSCGAR